MILAPGRLPGVVRIDVEPLVDDRGVFARTWCARELAAAGIDPRIAQCNISYNRVRGTLRGLHYQAEPHAEAKFVRCTAGAIFDVIVDLRPGPTYLHWESFTLSAANRSTLYVPRGCAHGFQTLEDATEVFYQMSEFYAPEAARGIAWDDPVLGIEWPLDGPVMSAKDRSYAHLTP